MPDQETEKEYLWRNPDRRDRHVGREIACSLTLLPGFRVFDQTRRPRNHHECRSSAGPTS